MHDLGAWLSWMLIHDATIADWDPSEEQNHESPCYMRAHMHTCACVFFFLYDLFMFLFSPSLVFVSHVRDLRKARKCSGTWLSS